MLGCPEIDGQWAGEGSGPGWSWGWAAEAGPTKTHVGSSLCAGHAVWQKPVFTDGLWLHMSRTANSSNPQIPCAVLLDLLPSGRSERELGASRPALTTLISMPRALPSARHQKFRLCAWLLLLAVLFIPSLDGLVGALASGGLGPAGKVPTRTGGSSVVVVLTAQQPAAGSASLRPGGGHCLSASSSHGADGTHFWTLQNGAKPYTRPPSGRSWG